ncbi:lysophospholipid acyltransferase family protein [Paenibacillus sp. Marseille-Q4541]|uniref:lysophospholipid acyltransferase family protein n=1 Tax=Paenibacillus sp. Marseille-Q4541 TaxID=2831522 RepID=UPI001BABD4A7|nr:lysophospholipid acyltransferase family protein [Paenibacillus sp. Marseille-Q4541]
MLSANKSRLFDQMFFQYHKKYLLERRFRYVGFAGNLDPVIAQDHPVLYIMNHSSWWDGLLAYHTFRLLTRHDHYVMMEEKQLNKFSFFRKLGAFSINKESAADVRSSFEYTVQLLLSGKRVWMYPQGKITHQDLRPLSFQRGIGVLLRRLPNTAVIPVTLVHGMYGQDKPEALLMAGPPLLENWGDLDSRVITRQLEAVMEEQLNQQKLEVMTCVDNRPERYKPLVKSGRSTSERFDDVFVRKRV